MTTPETFAHDLLDALGLPDTAPWQQPINAWVEAEGGFNPQKSLGARLNNPLNAHSGIGFPFGVYGGTTNGENLNSYASLDDAVRSYAYGIKNFNYQGYKNITAATTPADLAKAIIYSPWAGGDTTGTVQAYSTSATSPFGRYLRGNNIPVPSSGTLTPVHGESVPVTQDPTNPNNNPPDLVSTIISSILNRLGLGVVAGPPGGGGGAGFDFGLTLIVNVFLILLGIVLVLLGLYTLVRPGNDWKAFGKAVSELSLNVAAEGYLSQRDRQSSSTPTPTIETPPPPAGPDYSPDTPRTRGWEFLAASDAKERTTVEPNG